MKFSHEMLIANAGSGKTFRLTIRTIQLLAAGVEPEKIAALTFTRKAAGEFVSVLFIRLAAAAADPVRLRDLQRDADLPGFDQTACEAILRKLTQRLHRVCMGTIDSLFGRIARAFPLETGLADTFNVLSETARTAALLETLTSLFREQGRGDAAFTEFLNLVRQQSRKQSELAVFHSLLTSVGKLHEKFLATPSGTVWGDENLIWPDGCAMLNAPAPLPAAEALWSAIESTHPDLDAVATAWWTDLVEQVRSWTQGGKESEKVTKLIKKDPSFDADSGRHYYPTGGGRKARVYLNPMVSSACEAFHFSMLQPLLREALRRSDALHRLLTGFEKIYGRQVRQRGMLTFSDITAILAEQVDAPLWRASVGYRIDEKFDHWLVDEFQDTSRLQWRVLGGLVDEIIQDTDGTRSFFYVGDTKQAIYSWRGGDPRLFFEIANHYNQSGTERIVGSKPLDVSFRSDPEIIDVVNSVFGNLRGVADELELPSRAVAEWESAWVKHAVAEKNQAGRGCVRWLTVDDDEAEFDDPVDEAVRKILKEVRPWERGWVCAVLMRDNKSLAELAAHLSAAQIPVAVEGSSNPCLDNPLGTALLAAFQSAASPDDRQAEALLACSPCASVWLDGGIDSFRERMLSRIAGEGCAPTVQSLLDQISSGLDPFLTSRAGEFVSAAMSFDSGRQSTDDVGAFVNHIANYNRQEPEGTGLVRLMTIHQAKGLTFDMTIVAGMGNRFSGDRSGGELVLGKNRNEAIWGLLLPSKELTSRDPVLDEAREEALATSTYGELCAAYVAMTRPRHGLYLVTKKLKEKTASKNLSRLLTLTLESSGDGFSCGDEKWFESRARVDDAVRTAVAPVVHLPGPLYRTPNSAGPSQAGKTDSFLAFSALQIGREVHEVLSTLEWSVKVTLPPQLLVESRNKLARFLKSDQARELFTAPKTLHHLWRERSFECVIDGNWVAGIFDRVLVHLGEDGVPQSAEIVDFKTDETDSATLEKRHAGQMTIYEKAAALLLGLPSEKIRARLVAVA